MDVPVFNMNGDSIGSMSIDEQILGGTVNPALIKQAYVRYHANLRQGSARSLTRSMVEGSSRKIYKQKGTGRARHGNKKPPHFRGGGHAFAKRRTREDFRLDMPKKMRRSANRNAFLAKLIDGEVKVIDGMKFDSPKTRAFVDMLGALGVEKSALVALSTDTESSKNAMLSGRNIDGVSMCRADQLTCFEMLNNRYLVIDKGDLEAWLSGPSSQTGKEAKVNPMGRSGGEEAA